MKKISIITVQNIEISVATENNVDVNANNRSERTEQQKISLKSVAKNPKNLP